MSALLLQWLTHLASTLYGGASISFALLLGIYPRGTGRPRAEVARVYRAAGPILGISMGVWVFAMLGARWFEHGAFRWDWDTLGARLDLATWLVFATLWLSSLVLEIWTLEPFRTALDPKTNEVTKPEVFERGYRTVTRHITLNAVIFAVWQALWVLGHAAP